MYAAYDISIILGCREEVLVAAEGKGRLATRVGTEGATVPASHCRAKQHEDPFGLSESEFEGQRGEEQGTRVEIEGGGGRSARLQAKTRRDVRFRVRP